MGPQVLLSGIWAVGQWVHKVDLTVLVFLIWSGVETSGATSLAAISVWTGNVVFQYTTELIGI
jgi:hypothetical protein